MNETRLRCTMATSLRHIMTAGAMLCALSSWAWAQQGRKLPDLQGTWQADSPDGPQQIIVRPDSSASFGEEIVRWRLAPDTVYLALGGEWVAYNYALKGRTLTLSGGDLEEPIELKRVGPPSPRPAGVAVPPDPGKGPARPAPGPGASER